MEVTREYVVDVLRRAGLWEVADEAESSLPEAIDLDQVADWALQRGITRDTLVSLLGGSP
jgi:hypothetical protein